MKKRQNYSFLGKMAVSLSLFVGLEYLYPGAALAQLRLGDEGQSVIMVQDRLRYLGYFNDTLTGYYDYSTKRAVMEFQQDCGLYIDGVVGEDTSKYIFTNPPPCHRWGNNNNNNSNNSNNGGGVIITNPGSSNKYYCNQISGSYVVAVPIQDDSTVNRVFNVVPNACIERDDKGDFVNAGEFNEYDYAQMRALSLQQSGLDARVIHR